MNNRLGTEGNLRNVAIDYIVVISYKQAMKEIAYTRAALKTLRRMPANTARLIREKIEAYAADPASLANNVKALKGRPSAIRLRVADWRVIMEDGKVLAVLEIGPRGSIYE